MAQTKRTPVITRFKNEFCLESKWIIRDLQSYLSSRWGNEFGYLHLSTRGRKVIGYDTLLVKLPEGSQGGNKRRIRVHIDDGTEVLVGLKKFKRYLRQIYKYRPEMLYLPKLIIPN